MTATVPTLKAPPRPQRTRRPVWEEQPTVVGNTAKGLVLVTGALLRANSQRRARAPTPF